MKNHKAMQLQRRQRGIKHGYNDNRVQPSWGVFKIVNIYLKAFARFILKMKFKLDRDCPRKNDKRVTFLPSFPDLSRLAPIFKCLCSPCWLSNEMEEDGRVDMPSMYHYVKNTAINGGKQDEEESGEETSRKLDNHENPTEKLGKQGDGESAVDLKKHKVNRMKMLIDNIAETGAGFLSIVGYDEWEEKRNAAKYRAHFDELGLKVVETEQDGNCMFRALADQLYGDQEQHETCRRMVVNYMIRHPQQFTDFFEGGDEGFQEYCEEMADDGVWGDNLELQAASLLFHTNILLYVLKDKRIEITKIDNFHGSNASAIRLSYRNGSHYDSLHVITEDNEGAQQVTEGKDKINDTEVTAALASYPGIEKYDQNILRLVSQETIGSASIEEAIAALELHNWNADDAIENLLGTEIERLAKGLTHQKLDLDGPPLLSSALPYREESDEDTVRLIKAQTVGMADSPRIQDALKLMNGDIDATITYIISQRLPIYASGIASYSRTEETEEELERERIKEEEAWADKLKQHVDSGGSTEDNSIKKLFDNFIPETTSMLPETGKEENKEINLECKAVDDNEEDRTSS
ncbi:hypothetical protein SUGI_0037580 [Cryptomeria japonica]|nr:hypothetical protein SUGI_0037580 [Cryptomeria japonica]